MAFGMGKKTADDLIKLFSALPDEEKAKFLAEIKPDAETDEQVAKESTEEQGANAAEPSTEVADTSDASAETSDDTSAEAVAEDDNAKSDPDVAAESEAEPDNTTTVVDDTTDAENRDAVVVQLTDRLNAMEEELKGFRDLKAQMEEFTAKQAERFGYTGRVAGMNKDMRDMSADELKQSILTGK